MNDCLVCQTLYWTTLFVFLLRKYGPIKAKLIRIQYRKLRDVVWRGQTPIDRDYSLAQSVTYGVSFEITAMAGVREKLKYSDIPDGLKGLGVTLITAGLIALAFMSFSGEKL